jgi:hypothetical protein
MRVRGIPRGMDVALNVNKSLGPIPPQGDELNPNLLLLRQFFFKKILRQSCNRIFPFSPKKNSQQCEIEHQKKKKKKKKEVDMGRLLKF